MARIISLMMSDGVLDLFIVLAIIASGVGVVNMVGQPDAPTSSSLPNATTKGTTAEEASLHPAQP